MQGDSGDAPLHRPGLTSDTQNVLNGPLGVLVRFGSFGCLSVGSFVARIRPQAAGARKLRPFNGAALGFS